MNRSRPVITLAALALSGILLSACASQTTRVPDLGLEPQGERLARAHQLALEGQRAQKAGEYDRAMDFYQESLQHSQELHAVWNNMGLLLMEEYNFMDAAEMFRIAADLAPFDPQPHYNLARVYEEAGHPQRAMEHYDRSLERDPRYILSLRGQLLAAKRLDIADQQLLQRVRTALLVERDLRWREFHEREQMRIESALRDQRNDSRSRSATR